MRQSVELLLGLLSMRDVVISPCDAPNRTVRIVYRRCGQFDVNQRTALMPTLDFQIANSLTIDGSIEQLFGLFLEFRRNNLRMLPDRLFGRVAERLLRGPAPQHNLILGIAARYCNRRGIDPSGNSFLRLPLHLLQFGPLARLQCGSLSGLIEFTMADLKRRCHRIERGGKSPHLIAAGNSCSMT